MPLQLQSQNLSQIPYQSVQSNRNSFKTIGDFLDSYLTTGYGGNQLLGAAGAGLLAYLGKKGVGKFQDYKRQKEIAQQVADQKTSEVSKPKTEQYPKVMRDMVRLGDDYIRGYEGLLDYVPNVDAVVGDKFSSPVKESERMRQRAINQKNMGMVIDTGKTVVGPVVDRVKAIDKEFNNQWPRAQEQLGGIWDGMGRWGSGAKSYDITSDGTNIDWTTPGNQPPGQGSLVNNVSAPLRNDLYPSNLLDAATKTYYGTGTYWTKQGPGLHAVPYAYEDKPLFESRYGKAPSRSRYGAKGTSVLWGEKRNLGDTPEIPMLGDESVTPIPRANVYGLPDRGYTGYRRDGILQSPKPAWRMWN